MTESTDKAECPECHKLYGNLYLFERHLVLQHEWPIAKAQQFANGGSV